VSDLSEFLSEDGLQRLIAFLTRPATYMIRATENLEDRGSYIERRTRLELSSGGTPHFVPIAEPLRGSFVDIVEVQSAAGVHDLILGRTDTLRVVQVVMAWAVEQAGLNPQDADVANYTLVAQLDAATSASLFNTLRGMRRPDIQISEDLEKSAILARNPSFFALFSFFRMHQLLLVPCSPERELFKLTFVTHIGQSRYRGRSTSERTRQFLGLAPYRYRVEIPLALTAQSYHLRMRGPSQHYVRHLEILATFLSVTQSTHRIKDWELRRFTPIGAGANCSYRDKDIDNLARLYARQLAQAANRPRRIVASLQFDERPLGQLGGAIARLTAVLVSIYFAASMAGGLIGNQSTLVPALLVALPGALGISALLNAGTAEMAAPILARIGSISAALSSIVATFAIVSWISFRSGCDPHDKCDKSMPVAVHHVLWGVEATIEILIVLCLLMLLRNMLKYASRSKGPPLT
jgi:hypothetical protein